MLNTNIRSKLILIKLLQRKLIVKKDMLKPKINRDISWLVQSRTTKTLLRQLLVTYLLGTQRVTYLIIYYIILLLIVYSDLLFIVPILYPILNILALLIYQTLLASLLGIIYGIDGYSIVLNLIQLFSISARIRERLGNIIVKDIKGMPLLRPRLLESLKLVI